MTMHATVRSRGQDTEALLLGRYRLGDVIGRGGMSTVYRGVDVTTGGQVAIKVLAAHLSQDEGFRHRLVVEAQAVSRLPHPNVVRLIDWGVADDGAAALVMELVDGETLAHRLQQGPLPVGDAVSVARQMATALAFAHDRGVIHRDVKPHNILLARRSTAAGQATGAGGAPLVAKLADFSIARIEDTAAYTSTGLVMGSAPYVAPELLRGQAASPQSDLYALGVTLFQMLTGHLPFEADTAAESLTRRLVEDAPRLHTLLPIAPPWLDETVAALLAREPAHRPPNATALVARLGQRHSPMTRGLPRWTWPTQPMLVARPARTRRPRPATAPRPARGHARGPVAASRGRPAPQRPLIEQVRERRRAPAALAAALLAVFVLLAASAIALGPRRAAARAARPAAPAATVASAEAAAAATQPASPTAVPTEAPAPTAAPAAPVAAPPPAPVRPAPAPPKGDKKGKRH